MDVEARLMRFDVNGETYARYQYDTENDSLDIRYRDSSREHFAFSNGRIVEAANEHSTVRLTYDALGRLLSEDTDGRVVRYLRNEVGGLIGIVTPQGEAISYLRDRDQRLTGIMDWVGGRYSLSLEGSGPPNEHRNPN
jgi:YD repeat-containing protein